MDIEYLPLSVDGFRVNCATGGISSIRGEYGVWFGKIDLQEVSANYYLEILIYGLPMMVTEEPIGHVIIGTELYGAFAYPITQKVAKEEWRVLVGRGFTKRISTKYADFAIIFSIPFELKGVKITAIRAARLR